VRGLELVDGRGKKPIWADLHVVLSLFWCLVMLMSCRGKLCSFVFWREKDGVLLQILRSRNV